VKFVGEFRYVNQARDRRRETRGARGVTVRCRRSRTGRHRAYRRYVFSFFLSKKIYFITLAPGPTLWVRPCLPLIKPALPRRSVLRAPALSPPISSGANSRATTSHTDHTAGQGQYIQTLLPGTIRAARHSHSYLSPPAQSPSPYKTHLAPSPPPLTNHML
jgi:hypothetical protein